MQGTIFGRMPDGRSIEIWRLGDASGLSAGILTYGARIAELVVPTRGGPRHVALELPDAAAWLADRSHQGAIAGRYANRIHAGRFELDGTTYQLPVNNGTNTLHGGPAGFAYCLWTARAEGEALVLTLRSPDGDQGFPGALETEIRYRVSGMELAIDIAARSDAATVLNLTNHCYFNLDGAPTIEGHELTVAADRFAVVDETFIPTGELRAVAGTEFDFRAPRRIGAGIDADEPQLRQSGGYDHSFVLGEGSSDAPRFAARVAAGGISMEIETTEPAVQLYTGNMLKGQPHARRSGLCLETQHLADSPNRPEFPSTVLRPGKVFRSRTVFRFAV